MADSERHEIFIIKRHASYECDHHGGAWKIAFADFMTAMMALFLVLWLISSTTDKTKHTVAQYFNPVKLVDMTTLKKGFRDPKETEMGSGPNAKEAPEESSSTRRKPARAKDEVTCQTDAKGPAQVEAALFRDPYAALAEIVANTPNKASKSASGAASSAATNGATTFSDPFTTTPHEQEAPLEDLLSLTQGREAHGKVIEDKESQDEKAQRKEAVEGHEVPQSHEPQEATETAAAFQEPAVQKGAQGKEVSRAGAAAEVRSAAAAAAKLKSDIGNAINSSTRAGGTPPIEVQASAEGILISLTDDANFSMFAIGSAEPRPETVQIMQKIGEVLKASSGSIVIRGHTDGRPYRSPVYDNWRLSSARAQMALYMLARGGVSEKRIENVEGFADHLLKIPSNPNASENRRIEILLRKENP
ncbi:MAG TPA: MotB family protein [Methylocella sp.]|nr:MotB family protein [Methylocella sp.]